MGKKKAEDEAKPKKRAAQPEDEQQLKKQKTEETEEQRMQRKKVEAATQKAAEDARKRAKASGKQVDEKTLKFNQQQARKIPGAPFWMELRYIPNGVDRQDAQWEIRTMLGTDEETLPDTHFKTT